MLAMIGESREYYSQKFMEMRRDNNIPTWNWAAFLAGPFWLFYRKMYIIGGGALLLGVILSLINSAFTYMLFAGIFVALGILGNYLYMDHLERELKKANSEVEPARSAHIGQYTGVNMPAAVLSGVGYFAFLILILAMV